MEILKGCPPLAGRWPERIRAVCACCRFEREFLIDRRPSVDFDNARPRDNGVAISDGFVDLVAKTISQEDWLYLVSSERAEWLCPRCVDEQLDFDAPLVRQAFDRQRRLRKIEVHYAPRRTLERRR